MSTLLDNVSTWIISADALPDTPPGGFSPELLDGLLRPCEKGRDSVRQALATRTGDPDERLLYRPVPMTAQRPRLSMTQWMGRLVRSVGSLLARYEWLT